MSSLEAKVAVVRKRNEHFQELLREAQVGQYSIEDLQLTTFAGISIGLDLLCDIAELMLKKEGEDNEEE